VLLAGFHGYDLCEPGLTFFLSCKLFLRTESNKAGQREIQMIVRIAAVNLGEIDLIDGNTRYQ